MFLWAPINLAHPKERGASNKDFFCKKNIMKPMIHQVSASVLKNSHYYRISNFACESIADHQRE